MQPLESIKESGTRAERRCRTLMAFAIGLTSPFANAVEIDGKIDTVEWKDAQYVTDFRKTQPLNGEPASLKTEAWILSTLEGLAVAFRNTQPPEVPRTRQRVQRDFNEQVDRINVMIDFDGDRRTGYDITVSSTGGIFDGVITNENEFNADWDGNFKHAVAEDDAAWTVEVLLPWHLAPMHSVKTTTRTIGLYLDRVIGATGERSGWPLASFQRPRFLSDFAQVTVTNYSQSLLAITPYVSGLYDNVDRQGDADGGVDVFWKPNGQFQLTASVNPDFGQVESDDLIVNFDATETFISDKRPFFTENQGLFEFTTPSDFSQLLYTRRVGGPADDGVGSGDITAALKLNGSFGTMKYGVFAADERGEAGRSFAALRLVQDFTSQNLGFMMTNVDRPFLDRNATVAGIDHNWRPTEKWNVRTRVVGSHIEHNNETIRGSGATLLADYEMQHGWRQQWTAMHLGNDLQLNDAGYLSRNSTNYSHWQLSKRFADLPPTSHYASKEWRWRAGTDHNDHGDLLAHYFRVSRSGQLRDGSSEEWQINAYSAGYDDLLMRGNGLVRAPAYIEAFGQFTRPRKGNWAFQTEVEAFSGGLSGNHRFGYRLDFTPTYFVNDAVNVYAGINAISFPDWVFWQRENLIGSFEGKQVNFTAGFNWTMSEHQELRLKLQAIAFSADAYQAYRVDANGHSIPTDEPVDDFRVSNLALQIRYRYELAPLSYLYVVYGRGGYEQEPLTEKFGRTFRDSFSLRDDEQLLIKLSYRFER